VHTGTAVPLRRSNVDTDQIIPAVYLKRVTRTGFEDGLFSAWRANEPDFVLNRAEYRAASILVAGPDFGTGSSREHAVWALSDYGFRAVISPRFADIFRGNSLKSGLLTVELGDKIVQQLWDDIEADPSMPVTVDLEQRQVRWTPPAVTTAVARSTNGTEEVHEFVLDDYARWRLLEGLDDIDLTLRHADAITAFEAGRLPWSVRVGV
jgi:3-isopropylmalate/(R)-2-methylmalate dehydratase small subunit